MVGADQPSVAPLDFDSGDPEPILVDDLLDAGGILENFYINFYQVEKYWLWKNILVSVQGAPYVVFGFPLWPSRLEEGH